MSLRRSSRTVSARSKPSYVQDDSEDEDEAYEEEPVAVKSNLRSSRRIAKVDEEYTEKTSPYFLEEANDDDEKEEKLSVSQMRKLQLEASLAETPSQRSFATTENFPQCCKRDPILFLILCENLALSSFEELPDVFAELPLDDLKEFCAANNLKPPRARTGVIQTILEAFGTIPVIIAFQS